MSNVVKLGRMRTGEIADRLARGEVLELQFYNRRIGIIVPAPHQAATGGKSWAFHKAVIGIAKELYSHAYAGEVNMKHDNIMALAQELLDKFGDSNA